MEEENTPIEQAPITNPAPLPDLASENKRSKKRLGIIIGAIFIFLILAGIGTFYYLKTQQNKSISTGNENLKLSSTPIPSRTPTPTPENKISTLVTYKLPPGWKEKKDLIQSKEPYYALELVSPNLNKSCCGGPDVPAAGIFIEYLPIEKAQTLDEEYKEVEREMNDKNDVASKQLTGLKKTTLGGLPGISYVYDFEGHTHTYKVWSPKYLYTVTVATSFPEDETKNLQDINYILDSLKFTE